jgi:hypothetical protein
MAWGQPLGLDELMIVNPSPPNTEAYFLGEDGTLYQVQGLGQEQAFQDREQYFLGEDNTLYQVQGLGQTEGLQGLGQYFLGEDGNLYQLQRMGFGESPRVPMKQHTCRCMRE